jgi:hypothetical protein
MGGPEKYVILRMSLMTFSRTICHTDIGVRGGNDMDHRQFDALTARIGQQVSRRAGLAGLAFAALVGAVPTRAKHKKHKKKCKAPKKKCGKKCIAVQSDPGNCGSCGHACPAGQQCVGSHCQCPAGQHDCGGSCAACCPGDECCDNAACDDGNVCTTDTCQDGTCAHTVDLAADCRDFVHSPNGECQVNGSCAIRCTADMECAMVNSACICQPDATGDLKHCRVIVESCEGKPPCESTADCPVGTICQFTSQCDQTVCVDACHQ